MYNTNYKGSTRTGNAAIYGQDPPAACKERIIVKATQKNDAFRMVMGEHPSMQNFPITKLNLLKNFDL